MSNNKKSLLDEGQPAAEPEALFRLGDLHLHGRLAGNRNRVAAEQQSRRDPLLVRHPDLERQLGGVENIPPVEANQPVHLEREAIQLEHRHPPLPET